MEPNVYHAPQLLATALRGIADATEETLEAQRMFEGALREIYKQVASLSETLKLHGSFDPLAPVFPLSDLSRAVLEHLVSRAPAGGSPLQIARALNAPRVQVTAVLQAMKTLGITYSPMRGYYRLGSPLSKAELRARLGVQRERSENNHAGRADNTDHPQEKGPAHE